MTEIAEPKGILAVWHDMAPEAEAMLNEWYNREHHAERVAIAGFLSARRYRAIEGAPKYCAVYRTESPQVLASEPYLACLNNPSEWSRRAFPGYRNMSRNVCRELGRVGRAEGGVLLTVRLAPAAEDGAEDALQRWCSDALLPELGQAPGIVCAALWQVVRELTLLPNEERRLRGGEDAMESWIIAVYATDEDLARAARQRHLAAPRLEAHGAAPAAVTGLYRLMFALDR